MLETSSGVVVVSAPLEQSLGMGSALVEESMKSFPAMESVKSAP